MSDLTGILVTGSKQIELPPAKINNNNNSTNFFKFFQAVVVPAYLYFKEAVDKLRLKFTNALNSLVPLGVRFNQAGGIIFSEQVNKMLPDSSLGFIIIALLTLIQIKCQANPKLPFHPKAMKTWVNIVLIYCFASAVEVVILSAVPKNTGSRNLEVDITTTPKGVPWTEEEHRMFLLGLQELGKGNWRGIARNYVITRTPTRVASHAQKYFIRQSNISRRKRRSSLFDMVADDLLSHIGLDQGQVKTNQHQSKQNLTKFLNQQLCIQRARSMWMILLECRS